MIIKYDDKIYADFGEDCYMDNNVEDIDSLLNNMDCNGDIESYDVTHYIVDGCEIGDDDDKHTALENFVERQKHFGYGLIEVIKE